MTILFVNACMRGEDSRTLALCREFFAQVQRAMPDVRIIEHDLTRAPMQPVTAATLAEKEPLCDRHAWDHPMFARACEFQAADAVVIGAPYWDMSFPSVLKVWVENMYVRNLTFRYVDDQSEGLCRGRESVYITTAGSPIGADDWGAGYMRAVLHTLGIPEFTSIAAESLDMATSDAQAIMRDALQCVRDEADAFVQRMAAGQ